MAVYLYRSPNCDCEDRVVEHSMSADPFVACRVHGLQMHRVPQAAGVVLKGTGFYRNEGKS
jgi:predicted nucleic acid-binding Zn ribbon protein